MEIHLRKSGAVTVGEISGELNTESGENFRDAFHEFSAAPGMFLALDLSRLTMIDSIGLSALIHLVTRARLTGARVVLVDPSPFVAGILNTTRLDKWFEVYDSLDDASAAMQGQ